MSIALEAARNVLVELAKNKIGSQLATIKLNANSTQPAVLKARKALPTKPAFPYCILDIQGMRQDPDEYQGMFVTENGFPGYYSRTEVMFSYTVYGGDAVQIINDLWRCFRQSSVRDLFRTAGVGAISDVEGVVVSNQPIANDWVDIASFNLYMTIMDFREATEEPMIDTVISDQTSKFNIEEFITQITVMET